MNFKKILIFYTYGLLNTCSEFQNDIINIIGDVTSESQILFKQHWAVSVFFLGGGGVFFWGGGG